MKDIIRDSTVGQLINYISGGRYLPYADHRSDYQVPEAFPLPSSTSESQTQAQISPIQTQISSIDQTQSASETTASPLEVLPPSLNLTRSITLVGKLTQDYEKGETKIEKVAIDPYLIGWSGDDDPENPRYVLHILYFNF